MNYTPMYNSYASQILAIAEQVKAQYPEDWARAHNGTPAGNVYIRRVAWAVSQQIPQINCGLNGKRGNINDLSQDILAFPNATGCTDAGGTYAGLELHDIIIAAGSTDPNNPPRLGWGDATADTITGGSQGAWVAPMSIGVPVPVPPPVTIPPFPPRNETLEFGLVLNAYYQRRITDANPGAPPNGTLGGALDNPTPVGRYTDYEGEVVWLSEYLRRRQLGESHADATAHVLQDVAAAWG